ncbi:hypothetical protein EB796_010032 [Bugula neritina]|uniref:Uncharacterized protein n=1 Tax=Bugula neritina TaxID=10212 RepID=A0A7J7JZ27_BUGNE|nr:hypothetical protein EB796_010032 [Bugula neritina]
MPLKVLYATEYMPLKVLYATEYMPLTVLYATEYMPLKVLYATEYMPLKVLYATEYMPLMVLYATEYMPLKVLYATEYMPLKVLYATEYMPLKVKGNLPTQSSYNRVVQSETDNLAECQQKEKRSDSTVAIKCQTHNEFIRVDKQLRFEIPAGLTYTPLWDPDPL